VIGYLIRRFLQAVVVLIIVTMITFGLLHLMPGGPVAALLGSRASQAEIKEVTHALGYDRPLPIQYWHWLDALLHGNLGFSYKKEQTVSSLLAATMPKTVVLIAESTILAVVIAVPMGMIQAFRRNTIVDYIGTVISFALYSSPVFFLGLLSLMIFSVTLGWFGPEAPQTQGNAILPYITDWHDMFLPVMTLALPSIAGYSRYVRSSVLDQITQDYVRTAVAKGASQRRVMYKHVLRNALMPLITLLGYALPSLFTGAFITEIVFNIQGLGQLYLNSALNDDFAVMLGLTVIITLATVIGSLLADIGYAALDPRVRLTGE
jgi:peptide/nickel transport system permease protein